MAKFSFIPCLDQDILAALRSQLLEMGLDPDKAEDVNQSVTQRMFEDGTIEWRVHDKLILRLRREVQTPRQTVYKLDICKLTMLVTPASLIIEGKES